MKNTHTFVVWSWSSLVLCLSITGSIFFLEKFLLAKYPQLLQHESSFVGRFWLRDALCLIFMILVSLENVKKYSHVVARLPQRLKSTLFEIFSTLRVPFGHPPFEKISNNVDFSLWGKQCICPAKMRPKLWKSHIVQQWRPTRVNEWLTFHSDSQMDHFCFFFGHNWAVSEMKTTHK